MTAGLFPDVQDALCDLLADLAGGSSHLGLITPPNLADVLPYLRIECIGGSDDHFTDRSTADIEAFANSIPAANLLGEQVRQLLIAGPHLVDGAVLDRVDCVSRPRPLPWGTPDVFRSFATYRVQARRTTT